MVAALANAPLPMKEIDNVMVQDWGFVVPTPASNEGLVPGGSCTI